MFATNLIAQINLKNAVIINEKGESVGQLYDTPAKLINLIVPNLFIFAGVFMLFLLIGGGLSIISSGTADGVQKGSKQVTTAILGFIVMFSAYWIIQIVEYLTGIKILSN